MSRSAAQLLRDRTFGPFFAGKVVSLCGMWLQNVVAALLMYELTGSAFMVAMVSMAQFLGPLLLSPWAGVATDRFNRRHIIITGRVLSGATTAILALILALPPTPGRVAPPMLLAAMLVMGFGFAMSGPAMQAIVPALVPDEDLEQALALSSVAPSLARMIGPAVGAGLLATSGPAVAFGVAAVAHWAFVGALLVVGPRPSPRPDARPPLLGGVRYLREDRRAALLLLAIMALIFGVEPALTLAPSLADGLGGGEELVGLLLSAFGVGAFVSSLGMRPLRRLLLLRQLGVAGFCLQAAGVVWAAASGSPAMATAGFVMAGAGFMLASVTVSTRIQRRVPDELRGRVMALWTMAFVGSRPLAAFVHGLIAEFGSVRAALLTAGVVTLAGSALVARRDGAGQPPEGGDEPDTVPLVY